MCQYTAQLGVKPLESSLDVVDLRRHFRHRLSPFRKLVPKPAKVLHVYLSCVFRISDEALPPAIDGKQLFGWHSSQRVSGVLRGTISSYMPCISSEDDKAGVDQGWIKGSIPKDLPSSSTTVGPGLPVLAYSWIPLRRPNCSFECPSILDGVASA